MIEQPVDDRDKRLSRLCFVFDSDVRSDAADPGQRFRGERAEKPAGQSRLPHESREVQAARGVAKSKPAVRAGDKSNVDAHARALAIDAARTSQTRSTLPAPIDG